MMFANFTELGCDNIYLEQRVVNTAGEVIRLTTALWIFTTNEGLQVIVEKERKFSNQFPSYNPQYYFVISPAEMMPCNSSLNSNLMLSIESAAV